MKELKVGDKIVIKEGMKIATLIPEKFINPDKPFSSELRHHFITVGNTYQQGRFLRKEFLKEFKNRICDLFFLTDQQIEEIIDAHPTELLPKLYHTNHYAGTYTVTHISQLLIGDVVIYASKECPLVGTLRIYFYSKSDTMPVITDIEVVS